MRINIISILAPLAAAAIITGCDKTATERTWSTDPDAVIVNASVGTLTRSNPLGNEEEQKKFNPGDVISIWQKSTNKIYDYVLGESGWGPAKNDEYMVWPSNKKDNFSATYQYSASKNLVTDQSTLAGLASADCMVNEAIVVSEAPSDNKLSFTLNRIFSLVTVRIAGYNDQYNAETDKISDLKIYLTHSSSVAAEAVSPYVLDAQGKEPASAAEGTIGWTYSAIGRSPRDNADKAVFIEFKIAGKTETVTGIPTLENGKKYTFNLTVGKNKIEVGDVTVSDWGPNEDLGGGNDEYEADKVADPINITALRKQLEEWNKANPDNLKELKDLITKKLLDECCVKGKLIVTGEFDNTEPLSDESEGMSKETIEAFAKIAAYVRDNDVTCLDLSGLKGVTSLTEVRPGNIAGAEEVYNLRFSSVVREDNGTGSVTESGEGSKLETFIGSEDVVNITSAFEKCAALTSVSGLDNVTDADFAFANCSKLTETPAMPNVLSLKYTFFKTLITRLEYDSVKEIAVTNCSELTIIKCPSVVKLEQNAFYSLPKLTELHLTSKFFESVHSLAFNAPINAPINGKNTLLYLDASQKNIINTTDNTWTPMKSDGKSSAVEGGTSVYIDNFKAVYCGTDKVL